MLFNSVSYLVFFPLVFALYWLAPQGKIRQVLLLVASYFFYMSWLPQYGLLLFTLTVVNYILGIAIERFRGWAKVYFVTGLIINLGSLCYYKYANFVLETIESLLRNANVMFQFSASSADFPTLNIILPLAISFFAFEFIHYLSDVYKGDKPIRSPLEFALFASFFPSSIAGPIKRYQDFIQKLRSHPKLNQAMFSSGMALLLQGLFKKVALADNLAIVANQGFQNYQSLGFAESWITTLAFTFQIYFDFSGYTDMGRGSAKLLGIDLPKNFNLPYLASDVSDFWKRWHISLSTWLRDYLYIPLGGNRVTPNRKKLNLLTTMLLGGLWHGAAWHYVVWGAIHGVGLIIFHEYSRFTKTSNVLTQFHSGLLGKAVSISITFLFVVVTWVFFRADSIPQALSLLQSMTSFETSNVLAETIKASLFPFAMTVYLIYAISFTPNLVFRPVWFDRLRDQLTSRQALRIPCYLGVYLAAFGFSPPQLSAFIYFQF